MYGRRKAENYFEGINKDEVLFIDKKKSRELASRLRLQLPSSLTSLNSNTILRQSKNIVNIKDKDSITRDEARLLQKNMDTYEQARQMYVKALKKASNNYKSGTEYKGAQESLNASAEEVAGKVFGEDLNGIKYKIDDNEENLIDSEGHIIPIIHFERFTEQEIKADYKAIRSIVKDYLQSAVNKHLRINSDRTEVIIDKDIPKEYTNSKNTNRLSLDQKATKFTVVQELDNIIENAYGPQWKENTEVKHRIDAARGWRYYKTKFAFPEGDSMRIWEGIINVKMHQDGNDYVYDVTNIKRKKKVQSISRSSKATENHTTAPSNQKVAQADSKVNKKGVKLQIADEDSEGRKLTEEQQKFFNDSKVIDKDDRLKVMYHGSPNGGFTQFKNHLNFFTADKQYAEEYTHKSGASNPQIYEVYLNIKHPFDIRNPKVKKIFDNEYVKGGWAYSIDPSRAGEKMNTNTGLPDWTEADNIYDFLEENEYLDDYDGIVVDEGNASDGKGGNRPAGVSYITFQSNQAKNTTNMDPTSDPDIRLQLDDVDEEFDVALYKAENDSLRCLNDALQQQIMLARGKAVAHADISKVVNSVLSEYESSYRKSTLFQNIAHIYNYLNAGHDPNADTITETMTRLGKAILRESRIKDDTMVKQYEMLDSYSFFSGLGKTSRSIQTKTILPPQPIRWNGHRRRCSKTRAQPAQETVKHTHSGSCSF